MRTVFIVLSICATMFGCGGSSKSKSKNGAATPKTDSNKDVVLVDKGYGEFTTPSLPSGASVTVVTSTPGGIVTSTPGGKLIVANDCLTCHTVGSKVVGPAFKVVAAKYTATDTNIDILAERVIKGGSGIWGATPMPGHPTMAMNDAKTMVKYILSLKK